MDWAAAYADIDETYAAREAAAKEARDASSSPAAAAGDASAKVNWEVAYADIEKTRRERREKITAAANAARSEVEAATPTGAVAGSFDGSVASGSPRESPIAPYRPAAVDAADPTPRSDAEENGASSKTSAAAAGAVVESAEGSAALLDDLFRKLVALDGDDAGELLSPTRN